MSNHDEYANSLKEKTIAIQKAKMETYIDLKLQGLPIPPDLRAEIESVLNPTLNTVHLQEGDILHIKLGAPNICDGAAWIPTDEDIAITKAHWESIVPEGVEVIVTHFAEEAEIIPTRRDTTKENDKGISNRFIDFLYILARDHLTTGAIEDILYNFVDTEPSSFCNHFIEGYARDLAKRLLDDSVPITNWKHMYRSPDGKTKFTGGDNPHYGS